MTLRVETVQMIQVSDWDKLVQETYNRPYSLQQQDDGKSRGVEWITVTSDDLEPDDYLDREIPESIDTLVMCVSFERWLARDPQKPLLEQRYDWELAMWWQRNFYPEVERVANDLCKRGLIPSGDYGINIDW